MEQENQNLISQEKSPSDNKKLVGNKEAIEQNNCFDEEEGPEPSGNEEFQAKLNENEEVDIISNSTKPNDKNQKEEKHEGNENPNIPETKIKISNIKEGKSKKRQRKYKKTQKCCKKNRYKRFRGHIKITLKKINNKKNENIFSIYPLKAKKKIMDGIAYFFGGTPSFSNSNILPSYKKIINKLNIFLLILFFINNRVKNRVVTQSQNDYDDKLKEEDCDAIKNVSTNHYVRNYFYLLNGGQNYFQTLISTNYKTN